MLTRRFLFAGLRTSSTRNGLNEELVVNSSTSEKIVPRVVSGNLIIDKGFGLKKKSVRWRDENLVSIEYFDIDVSERVNVSKLKFEEVRRQQQVMEKSMMYLRIYPCCY